MNTKGVRTRAKDVTEAKVESDVVPELTRFKIQTHKTRPAYVINWRVKGERGSATFAWGANKARAMKQAEEKRAELYLHYYGLRI